MLSARPLKPSGSAKRFFQVKRLVVNLSDRFLVLFDKFAADVGETDAALIDFYLDDRRLDRGAVVGDANLDRSKIVKARKNYSGNFKTIEVKLQTNDRRKERLLKIRPSDPFSKLMQSYADLEKSNLRGFKFIFDGEVLDPQTTPEQLEFEGGECIDVFSSKF